MQGLLTLSRAARLVGVTRGALQKHIKSGALPTFEGMVAQSDLLRVFPQARMEDNSFLEQLHQIKDAAFSRRLRERLLPDAEVLAARVTLLGRELSDTRMELQRYQTAVAALAQRLQAAAGAGGATGVAATSLWQWFEAELKPGQGMAEHHPLAVRDSFLRLMTAHVRLLPSDRDFFVEGADTILEGALRAGLPLDYGCSNGNCGQCKARVVSGQVKKLHAHDYVLTQAERDAGVVLLCCHTAVSDLVVEAHVAGDAEEIPQQQIEVRVKELSPLGADVLLLHVQTPRTRRLRFLAGQSVHLGTGRLSAELSVASCPCDERNLHFHLRRRANDPFVTAAATLKAGDTLALTGPVGGFVLRDESTRPALFIACDDGFAPIKSLIEHAVAVENAESLHLYWLARAAGGHYLDNQCRAWADAFDHFHYTPLSPMPVPNGDGAEEIGAALRAIVRDHPDLAGYDAYVAGPEALVTAASALLLAGGLPRAQLRQLFLG